jgi:hypothetical protein
MFDRELPEPRSFVATAIESLQMQAETRQAKSCLLSMHWIDANHERGRRFRIGSRRVPPTHERDEC